MPSHPPVLIQMYLSPLPKLDEWKSTLLSRVGAIYNASGGGEPA
jgi:hypothetical protein